MTKHTDGSRTGYWKKNLQLVGVLLTIWFAVSLGCGILFVEPLNAFSLGGFPLGFWFAHQGAIVVFIGLIFAYCRRMDQIDAAYTEDEEEAP